MQTSKETIKKYSLPYLGFDEDALEPFIGRETMHVHYHKHHQGYVDKLNKAVEEADLAHLSLPELLENISKYNSGVRNNAGGHFNHTLFWRILNNERSKPFGKLLNQIEAAFGTIKNFREKFKDAAISHFGSGWAWLVLNKDGLLEIGTTPNQDNPLMDDVELKGFPLFGLDMWEHAYYLDYQNKKADYVDAFWNILDWPEVANRHEQSLLMFKS